MELRSAARVFAALGQETRLAALRSLVAEGSDGMAAGDLAKRLGVPANTLSAHLSILADAGLIESERRSRSIIYRADPAVRSIVDAALSAD